MTTPKEDIIEVKDGRLIINVALAENPPPSSTGKTLMHFTTHTKVDGYTLGLNLYKKR